MKVIGNHQEFVDDREHIRMFFLHREKLIQRVDFHELQARLSKYLGFGNARKRNVHHAFVACISIIIRDSQDFVRFGKQDIIDTPGVDTNRDNRIAITLGCFCQTDENFFP